MTNQVVIRMAKDLKKASIKNDESVLTVETTGALSPAQIILAGVDEVSNRLVEFKDMINQIKE